MNPRPSIGLPEASALLWDVIVVGAGPAGAASACHAARAGHKTLLLDAAAFPRPKVCGACLNRRALGFLEELDLGDWLEAIEAPRLNAIMLATGDRTIRLPLPGGRAVSRDALDGALAAQAVQAGASFLPGTAASPSGCDPEARTILGKNSDLTLPLRARIVLACDGLGGGFTRQALGPGWVQPGSRIGAGIQWDAPAGAWPPHTIGMFVGREGYVGLVVQQDGRLNCAAALDPEAIRRHGRLGATAAAILREAGGPELPDLERAPWRGTPPLTRRPPTLAAKRLFALGDAGGYIEPFTGEGMAWALEGARAAAPLVGQAVNHWDDAMAEEWTRTHRHLFAGRWRRCQRIAWLVEQPALCSGGLRLLNRFPSLGGWLTWRIAGNPAPLEDARGTLH